MIKGGALYLAITVSLIIGVICSVLLASFSIFQLRFLQIERYSRLENNINSAVNIALTDTGSFDPDFKTIDLADENKDMVAIKKARWGLFEIAVVKAFADKDTLTKIFTTGREADTLNTPTLYLRAGGQPFYVTNTAKLTGLIFLPEASLQTIDIDELNYQKYKASKITIKPSKRMLPKLQDTAFLKTFGKYRYRSEKLCYPSKGRDTLSNTFLNHTLLVKMKGKNGDLHNQSFSGNIVITGDSTLTIDSTTRLHDVILFARDIVVKRGFKGSCQFFASNSINVEPRCSLNYPSTITMITTDDPKSVRHEIIIGDSTNVTGTLISKDFESQSFPTFISIGTSCVIKGGIYCDGGLEFRGSSKITGSILTRKFLSRTNSGALENILTGVILNPLRSEQYMLIPGIFPNALLTQKVMQWIKK